MPNILNQPYIKYPLRLFLFTSITYAFGAIIYNGPAPAVSTINIIIAIIWLTLLTLTFIKLKTLGTHTIATTTLLLAVYIPYLLIQPSNDRDWDTDFTKTAYTIQSGDQITIHNYRDFHYETDGTPIPNWTTKTVHLSNLQGIDYFQDDFGGKLMGHPMLSFDFGPDGRVLISIETRREKGEYFSPIGGFYKMYELIYIVGSETDIIRVRTNFRKEPLYLYRFIFSPERSKKLFLTSLKTLNDLHSQPRFYHTLKANCTTSYRNQASKKDKAALDDWRLLANGQLDKMIYEKGWLKTQNLSFNELKEQSLITPTAQQIKDPKTFSTQIRENNPTFLKPKTTKDDILKN